MIMPNQQPSLAINSRVNLYLVSLLLALSSAVLAIWPMPGTIALRHILLGLGFCSSLAILHCYKTMLSRRSSWPLLVILGFFLWLLIHLIAFSSDFDSQFYELKHVWMRCLLATLMGLSLGIILTDPAPPSIGQSNFTILLILGGLSGTCLIGFSRYIYVAWQTHQLLNYDILLNFYKAKTPFVIGAALALPLGFILIIRSINRQMSRWWMLPSLLVICLSLFVAYFSDTKNGMAVFSICLIIFILNLASQVRWSWRKLLLAMVICPIIISASFISIQKHIQKNQAWPSLIANYKVGLDIDHQNNWKDRNIYPLPLNEFGKVVDTSTYERTAWFTAGIRLLAENPMGYGLLHHSFGVLALEKWPDFYKPNGKLKGATHSGWLDFVLGVGIPGLLLILIPLFFAWYRSLFQEGIWFSYAAWTIPIMSLAYLTTEVAGEHFTEVLFFMTAFFCGITLRYPRKSGVT